MSDARSILVQDDDCHWYVIPADMKPDWENWLSYDTNGLEREVSASDVPDYAARVGGSPSLVTFTDWRIE